MSWLQCSFEIDRDIAEEVDETLADCGALAVTLMDAGDQPVLEPKPGETPLWSRVTVTALFPPDLNPEIIASCIGELTGEDRPKDFCSDILADRAWEREWMKDFAPMQFGQRLWICPTCHQPPDDAEVVVTLDPGVAFGTGTHATTALCLEWLDSVDPAGLTVVDYGCGSGILGIAAACMGARRVFAVDNDPQALQATRRNARENNVEDRIETLEPGAVSAIGHSMVADITLANILAGPLLELAPTFADLTAPAGRIVLSGILEEQETDIVSHYARWFEMDECQERDGWLRLSGRRMSETS